MNDETPNFGVETRTYTAQQIRALADLWIRNGRHIRPTIACIHCVFPDARTLHDIEFVAGWLDKFQEVEANTGPAPNADALACLVWSKWFDTSFDTVQVSLFPQRTTPATPPTTT
jgi:hypothetical protein